MLVMVLMEDIKWKKKAKVQWIKETDSDANLYLFFMGNDSDAKFFHRIAASRSVNNISRIRAGEMMVDDDKIKIKDHVTSFYKMELSLEGGRFWMGSK